MPKNKAVDWNLYGTAADATEVVLNQGLPPSGSRHGIAHISVSFDDTDHDELELFGMTKIGPLDLTDTAVLNLTTDVFTKAGHGFTNDDKVVYYNGGGTSVTGLTSGTTYFVVGVSGNDFQLSASAGGAAINMSGTQANFGTSQLIIPKSKSWFPYDQLSLNWDYPLPMAYDCPIYLKITPNTGIQARVNMDGVSGGF